MLAWGDAKWVEMREYMVKNLELEGRLDRIKSCKKKRWKVRIGKCEDIRSDQVR